MPAATHTTTGAEPLPPSRLPQAALLSGEAAGLLRALLELLRPDAVKCKGGGPLAVCVIKSGAALALARPALLGRILPALLTLAKEVRSTAVLLPIVFCRCLL